MNPAPLVSVIIPTHNRRQALLRGLGALCRQTLPPERFEVIVTADGCRDGSAEAVTAFHAPYRLALVEQPGLGAAQARNAGAARAGGGRLVFVDDDIEAWPGLLEAHLRAAGADGDRAVIGYLPTALEAQQGYFRVELRTWWESMFSQMRAPGYRFRYSSLLTGNFSIPAGVFRDLGGFNPALRCHEDYEFGYRLMRAGIEFVFAPDAGGIHHEMTRLPRTFERKFQEGRADVSMARLHPELLPGLPLEGLYDYGGRLSKRFYRLAFDHPRLGDALAGMGHRFMSLLEGLGLRGRWRRALEMLLVYWYLRGAASALGNREQWRAFLAEMRAQEQRPPVETRIDLAAGLAAGEKLLDETRPDVAVFCYGEAVIGSTRPQPGAEALRGRHLRRILNDELGWELAGAIFPRLAGEDTGPHGRLMTALFARWRGDNP